MSKFNPKEAKRHLNNLRAIVADKKTPLSVMNEERVIKTIRKNRQEIWDRKIAVRS